MKFGRRFPANDQPTNCLPVDSSLGMTMADPALKVDCLIAGGVLSDVFRETSFDGVNSREPLYGKQRRHPIRRPRWRPDP